LSSRIVQQTLEGLAVSAMPRVRTTDGHLLDWDREAIAKQLLKETKLSEQFYKEPGITEDEAKDIAKEVERRVRWMNVRYLSGPLVREIMNVVLLERQHTEWRNICTRVGTPVYDAHLIDIGTGFEAKENANLQENAETSHKKKADKISKEQYLLLLPPYLADRHLAGDLHIHDLEYFGTRPFCIDGSTAVPVIDKGRNTIIRPDELPFQGDYYYPDDLYAISPRGPKKVKKVSRRRVGDDLLKIKTSSGKSLKVTREHRIPVTGKGIKKAEEIKPGDVLGSAFEHGLNLRGKAIGSLDLINEFVDRVPAHELETVFVRGARDLFQKVIDNGMCRSFSEISRSLGVDHHKEWFTRGIMPITIFKKFCEQYGQDGVADLRVGVTGSDNDLPANFPLTADLAKLLGYFISEGNYNIQPAKNYNLVITGSEHAQAVKCSTRSAFNTYTTMIEGGPSTRTIYGIEGEWQRSKQVYFGGKLIYLLFRYVFGVTGGSCNKRLPSIVYHMNDELLSVFLSALFTGDGSAFYRPEKSDCIINYTTASEMLRQELCLLLTSLEMNPQIVELYEGEERRTLYRIQLNGFRNIQTFSRWARFYDERQKHIDSFLADVKEMQKSPREEKVKEISAVKTSGEYVYDLFLEGDDEESHTYFASDGLLIHNCQDWDLRYFFYYGLMPDGLGTKASVAGPAKKPEVAILHAVKALGSAQTNFAGGQGFYNFLTFIAPYFEGLPYEEIKQLMQMFVYEMTQMMVARGGQLVFSSVQLTPGVPRLWRDKPAVYAGRVWNGSSPDAPLKTYGQFEREVRLAFKALMEVMLDGDYWGKPFNFPKPEISIEPDFMKEDDAFNSAHPDLPTYQDLYLLTFKLAAEFGTPYFDNQLPAYRGAGEGISCYQCLAGDELIPFVADDGTIRVKQIEELFESAAKNGLDTDANGVEFARLNASTLSVNFDTFKASLEAFKGVMRQSYKGKLLNITLATGRRIRVTPDHPVFALDNGNFARKQAKDLVTGEFLPILKNNVFGTPSQAYLDVSKTLNEAGFGEQILVGDNLESQATDAIQKLLAGDIHPLKIKKIEEEDYDGYVYDLVEVSNTHNFSNALGVVTGNCCAYQFAATANSDSQFDDKLYFKDGMHFSMGSWQVVSLNCPRAAYLARGDDELLFEYLRELMDTSVEVFKVKREWMNQIIKNHRMPFATQQPRDPITGEKGSIAVDLEGLVYTIGVVGVNEMVQFHTGKQMHESKDAWRLAVRAMTEMEIYAKKLSAQHGMTIALARTPAETTAQRFAVSDLIHEEFRECAERVVKGDLDAVRKNVQRTRDLPVYYTNGTHLTPSADVTVFERAKLEHVFFPIVDGGNIFHIFMGEATPDPKGLMEFGMRLARETQIGYFTFTKDMTVCLGCSQVSGGLKDKCPSCGSSEVDHISRITGYLQAVSGWNSAKRQELKDRKRYDELA